MKRNLFVISFMISISISITGCQLQNSEETTPAVRALVAYLNALVSKDEASLTVLSCADWEVNALLELDALQSVETSLEGLNCRQTMADDASATVLCEGKILTSYGGEVQEYDLRRRTYTMVEQGGNWLVCGY